MSDYIPDPRRTDPYGTPPRYEYTEDATGKSTYAVVALLGIVALVGGVLMFTGPQQPADQQAQLPPTTTTAPIDQPLPRPTPAAPAQRPAPATPPADMAPATPATPQQ